MESPEKKQNVYQQSQEKKKKASLLHRAENWFD